MKSLRISAYETWTTISSLQQKLNIYIKRVKRIKRGKRPLHHERTPSSPGQKQHDWRMLSRPSFFLLSFLPSICLSTLSRALILPIHLLLLCWEDRDVHKAPEIICPGWLEFAQRPYLNVKCDISKTPFLESPKVLAGTKEKEKERRMK